MKNVRKIAEKNLTTAGFKPTTIRVGLHGTLRIRSPGLLTSSLAASVLFEMKHALTAGSGSLGIPSLLPGLDTLCTFV